MKPVEWYLCYPCMIELSSSLKITKLDMPEPEKGECKMCHRSCYGQRVLVQYKEKGESRG